MQGPALTALCQICGQVSHDTPHLIQVTECTTVWNLQSVDELRYGLASLKWASVPAGLGDAGVMGDISSVMAWIMDEAN